MGKLFHRHKKNDEEVVAKASSNPESFEIRRAVVDAVLGMFRQIERDNSKGANYVLGIETNDILFKDLKLLKNANGLGLKEELLNCLFKRGFEIGSIEIKQGKIDGNPMRCVIENIPDTVLFLEKISVESVSEGEVTKARITLAPDSPGALKQPEGYVIDSKHTPYNIGRVIEPGDTTDRINHIEIIDETREYSSRSLAHIDYSEAVGFYISREKPTETNPVEVIRKNETKTLKNESATVILKDGDRLKLRHVILVFHTITE